MSNKHSQVTRELGKFTQALWFDLPTAMAQRILGNGDDDTLRTAGWKAYDAWVSLTNEATNRLYENPAIGALTARTMESGLRLQQVGSTIVSVLLSNLWPTLGLSTADQVSKLRAEIASLQDAVHETTAERTRSTSHASTPRTADEGLKLVRGHGHGQRTDEETENAAA